MRFHHQLVAFACSCRRLLVAVVGILGIDPGSFIGRDGGRPTCPSAHTTVTSMHSAADTAPLPAIAAAEACSGRPVFGTAFVGTVGPVLELGGTGTQALGLGRSLFGWAAGTVARHCRRTAD